MYLLEHVAVKMWNGKLVELATMVEPSKNIQIESMVMVQRCQNHLPFSCSENLTIAVVSAVKMWNRELVGGRSRGGWQQGK